MTYTILVVDDDAQARLLLTYILKRKGFEVLEADSGPAALASVAAQHPDLVLLDVIMPGMDGYAVCAALRDAPETRDLPVILITAKTDADAPARGMRAGANDYLRKPVQPDQLAARIQAALAGEALAGRPAEEP